MNIVEVRLGGGPGFPVRPDPVRGHLRYQRGVEKVREAIELVLRTEPGERLMRPDFGCGLRQFLMEPNTVATRARLEREISRALEAFEPRIKLRGVVAHEGEDPSLVLLSIRYEHRIDKSEATLVYPFYLER